MQKAPAQGGHKVNGADKSSNHGKVKSVPGRKTFRAQLVRAAVERVARCVRPGDTVAHMGENEFTVILPEVSRADDAVVVAEKILNELVEPFQLAG